MTDIELECLNCHSTAIDGGTEIRARLSRYEELEKAARALEDDFDNEADHGRITVNYDDHMTLCAALAALDTEVTE